MRPTRTESKKFLSRSKIELNARKKGIFAEYQTFIRSTMSDEMLQGLFYIKETSHYRSKTFL
jgi:hypothetical protein